VIVAFLRDHINLYSSKLKMIYLPKHYFADFFFFSLCSLFKKLCPLRNPLGNGSIFVEEVEEKAKEDSYKV